MSVLDSPLSFGDPLAVYFESGDYIVHNWKRNTWAVLSPVEYSAFSKLRTQQMKPRAVISAIAEQHQLAPEEAQKLMGRVLMLLWMRQLAVAPGQEYAPARPDLMSVPRTVPKAVYFVTTYRCNLACTYCYAESSPTASVEGDLTTAEALGMIDQIADLGVEEITFTGGEALTRRDIFELMAHAKERGLKTYIITNGGPVTREKAERLAALANMVTVSIDSPTPEGHDAMRGAGSHAAAMRAVGLLKEAGAKVSVNTALSVASVDELSEMATWAIDQGVAEHRFDYVSDLGRGGLIGGLSPSKEARAQAERKLFETLRERLSEINLSGILFHQSLLPPGVLKKHCGVGLEEISIDAKGEVYPCKLLHEPQFRAGNLRERSLKEIWADAPVLLSMVEVNPDNLPGCQNCTFRYVCGGGCRAHQWSGTGDLYGTRNEDCPSLRRAIRRNMWLLDRQQQTIGSPKTARTEALRC